MPVTIAIDERIYSQLSEIVEPQNQPLEEEILKALKEYIEKRREYLNDPFFKIGASGNSDITDGSVNHDKYLYGDQP